MPTLTVTKGLPASGKTTYARSWVAEDRDHRARVNRDDTRTMLHGGWLGTEEAERQVTEFCHAGVRRLLAAGVDVICDDTNLNEAHLDQLRRLAHYAGAGFEVRDFTDVPLDICLQRDAAREHPVGEQVIRGMWDRHLNPEGARS